MSVIPRRHPVRLLLLPDARRPRRLDAGNARRRRRGAGFLLAVLGLLLVPALLQGQAPNRFEAGSYRIASREVGAQTRFAGDVLHFLADGQLLWTRNDQPLISMQWSVKDDLLQIDDTDGCPVSPVGIYRVTWQERGFVTEEVSDGCGERAASAATIVLVPISGEYAE